MNESASKFLQPGDKFMPEMYLQQPGFTYSTCGPFTKAKKKLKSFCKMEIQTLFTEMSLIRLVFNTIWLMANQKV